MEIWKDVTGFKGMYMISDMGRLKSLKRTYLQNKGNKFNPTGITGLSEFTNKNSDKYWCASWRINGKRKSTYFSISKLGNDVARQQAIDLLLNRPDKKVVEIKEKFLKQTLNKKGYLQVQLCTSDHKHINKLVHCLVANAFISKIEGKPYVNHKNGKKTDCRKYNLEWVTQEENNNHAIEIGLQKTKKVKCKTTNKIFKTAYEAAEWVNFTKFNNTRLINSIRQTIRVCCRNKTTIAYGYCWEYLN